MFLRSDYSTHIVFYFAFLSAYLAVDHGQPSRQHVESYLINFNNSVVYLLNLYLQVRQPSKHVYHCLLGIFI